LFDISATGDVAGARRLAVSRSASGGLPRAQLSTPRYLRCQRWSHGNTERLRVLRTGDLATGERASRAFRHPSGPTQHVLAGDCRFRSRALSLINAHGTRQSVSPPSPNSRQSLSTERSGRCHNARPCGPTARCGVWRTVAAQCATLPFSRSTWRRSKNCRGMSGASARDSTLAWGLCVLRLRTRPTR
jgi:hypothetical protein